MSDKGHMFGVVTSCIQVVMLSAVFNKIHKEGNVLFNDTQHILFMVIWRRTYG